MPCGTAAEGRNLRVNSSELKLCLELQKALEVWECLARAVGYKCLDLPEGHVELQFQKLRGPKPSRRRLYVKQ